MYKLLTLIYNYFSTKYENKRYLKKNFKTNNSLLNKGYEIIKIQNIKINKDYLRESKIVNEYFKKFFIPEENIKSFIENYFIYTNLYKTLTDLTGFNFCIDYFIIYQTFHIPKQKENDPIYANNWHSDKPFSKNTIKVIFPLEHIGKKNGGIQIIDKNNSKKKIFNFENNLNNYFSMEANENEVLVFNPNECLHRAGIPAKNLSRKQIMFQLNPSHYWCYRSDIHLRQNNRETKFPILSRSKKISLNYAV